MNPSKSEAIKKFLLAKAPSDLANLYNFNMECQSNVGQDGGTAVEGEYKGRQWRAWSDGVQTWKSFRIPIGANTDEAHYEDSEMNYNFEEHVESIGMTGWNWKEKKSHWVAFDFDSLINHKVGLSNEELNEIIKLATDIPWVTIRKSTSGKGLHLYVFIDNDKNKITVNNHNEHSALARAILGKLAAITGYDFNIKIDTCGGNMWVWHRKLLSNPDGLKLIKQGIKLQDIPLNWQDHIKVINNKRKRILPQNIEETKADLFEELSGQHPRIPLDVDHKKLISWLQEKNVLWWWDQDHHMLVTHTIHLKQAKIDLGFKGSFDTVSPATDLNTQNCFLFPLRKGAWAVRRFSQGVSETENWDQDTNGWTRCYYNKEADLRVASQSFKGIEKPEGGFVFRNTTDANKAAHLLGAEVKLPEWVRDREASLKEHKDGNRIIFEIEKKDIDDNLEGWLADSKRKKWRKVINANININEPEVANYDDLVRHLITETGDDYGWIIKMDNTWVMQPLANMKMSLKASGVSPKDVDNVLGSSVLKSWKLVNVPFQPEYIGNREWNRDAAQFRFLKKLDTDELSFPTWKKLLEHCGSGLNDAIENNGWCKVNGILTGGDYLKCWIASLFQNPLDPLPYLFFYGPQNSGKSSFHEAIGLLITKGYVRADNAISNPSGFNGELENAIICVVEETDLSHKDTAYNRIKDWVTSRYLPIRALYKTQYSIPNTTHWCQFSNNHNACPVFPGDTRIVMAYVENIDPIDMIPKKELITRLEKEASDFLTDILKLEIPPSNDRLAVPIISTEDKKATEDMNQTPLERFITENTYPIMGKRIKFSEFCEKFHKYLQPQEVMLWSKVRIGREFPPNYPKGRVTTEQAQVYIGNISWDNTDCEVPLKYFVSGGILYQKNTNFEPRKEESKIPAPMEQGEGSNPVLSDLL